MRLTADTAIHALRLLKHAQDNAHGVSGPVKLAMYLPMASHPMFPQPGRRLEEVAFPDEGDASGSSIALTQSENDDLSALFENEYTDKIKNQCHVNVEGLLLTAITQGTVLQSGDKLAAAKAFSDPTYLHDIQAAFGDFDGQRTCGSDDLQTLMGSYSNFMTCTGMDALIGKVAVSGFDFEKMEREVMQKCVSLGDSSAVTSVFASEEKSSSSSEPTQEQVVECLGSIFDENNPIGVLIRDFYEHTNKYCSCFHELGEKVPECTVEEAGMKVSMSVIKSSTCILGVGCEAYKDFCKKETVVLEECLPGVDEEYDCTKVMLDCAKEGAAFTAIPHFVSHHLPDTCQDVAQESTIAKFESFQEKCAGKKDFLALAKVVGDDDAEAEPQAIEFVSEEDVNEIKSEEAQIIEEEEDLKEEQEEIMEELETAKTQKVEALEEQEEEDKSHASLPMAGIAIVACAVVASLVVIKKKFFSSKPQKTDFAPVADGGFEYEDDADAGNFIA